MAKFDKTLDQIIVSQMEMMNPKLRGKAERKKIEAEEKVRNLQTITQSMTDSGARTSGEEWADAMARIYKKNAKLPKKQRKRNKKFLQQLQTTAAANGKSWQIVSEGRSQRAAKF